jgi:hypothetical protein
MGPKSRAVLSIGTLAVGIAALSRLDGDRLKAIVNAPIRWVEIAKGPPHGAPM